MPRDYKNRRTRQSETTPGWVWGIGGLSIGLLIALAVHLHDRQSMLSTGPVANTAAVPSSAREPDPSPEGQDTGSRFDFYDMLPRFEVVIPETETEVGSNDTRAAEPADQGTYVLQAGSFRNFGDADRMKARLALLGIESQIQNVTIDDKQWHRVRLGPYDNMTAAQRSRRRLRGENIDVILLRVTE